MTTKFDSGTPNRDGQSSYDRSDIRRLNAVNVLQLLQRNGPFSRAAIASRLGLTKATVSNIAGDLIAAGLVEATDYTAGSPGRPGLLLQLNPGCGCMVAMEIDIDGVSLLLADAGQRVIWRATRPLDAAAPAPRNLEIAAGLVAEAIARGLAENLDCLGICVAWAGLVDSEHGELAFGPISGWEHVPLRDPWERRFGVPVYLANEAHAAAVGAHHSGPFPGTENLVYLSLGVGLAAGVLVGGRLLRGGRGFAGQVGHTFFADNGVPCNCGKTGCWVTEIGAAAVRRKLAAKNRPVGGGEPGDSDDWMEPLVRAARSGDPDVLPVLTEVAGNIGRGLSVLVHAFNPSAVVVGGRMGPLIKPVEAGIRAALVAEALPQMTAGLELAVSAGGDDHLVGALVTVLDATIRNPRIRNPRDVAKA